MSLSPLLLSRVIANHMYLVQLLQKFCPVYYCCHHILCYCLLFYCCSGGVVGSYLCPEWRGVSYFWDDNSLPKLHPLFIALQDGVQLLMEPAITKHTTSHTTSHTAPLENILVLLWHTCHTVLLNENTYLCLCPDFRNCSTSSRWTGESAPSSETITRVTFTQKHKTTRINVLSMVSMTWRGGGV